jgi:hypothetical protein
MAHARLRITTWTLIALAIGVLFFWAGGGARAARRVDISGWDDLAARTIPGAFHIHTTRSDGHGDRSHVAAAAARAGLKFVILTDHGDGTRPPDPPAYLDGVLVLDAVEISTEHGHYIAIDMPRAPYPLGGPGESVVEDVRRLGGIGIAAHPDSPKPSLRWTSTARPDGVEWINLDTEWRDETRAQLIRAGAAYLLRRGPALTMILDRPSTLDARWPALMAGGRSVALAAADAHGGVGRREEDPGRSLAGSIGIPSYESSFGTFSNRVILPRPLSGDAAADARAIYAAIRGGRVFAAVDGLAGPALLHFSLEAGFQQAEMGASLPGDFDGTLIARAPAPPDSEISILRNGRVVSSTRGSELRHVLTGATGAYRVEILLPGSPGLPPVPWLVSNPIYFGGGEVGKSPGPAEGQSGPPAGNIPPFPWTIEKDPASSATLRTGPTEASLEFKLGDGARKSQFVALATDVQGRGLSAIQLSLAGDRPMRVWVQLRAPDGTRWGRSYYVDPSGSNIVAPVSSLSLLGAAAGTATVRDATSLLLVVDLANAQPGRTGVLRVRASALIQ